MSANKKRVHPLYSAMLEAWQLGKDSYDGEAAIKAKRDTYLKPTGGMRQDGFGTDGRAGEEEYLAYLSRAVYPDVFSEAVESAVGVMHRKPATIEVTPKLENLLTRATHEGEDLQLLLRKMNSIQLKTGRLGLFGDLRVNEDGTAEPIIIPYNETCVFNWNETITDDQNSGLRMVALDESAYEMQANMEWKWKDKTRLLALVDPETNQMVQFDEDGNLPDNAVYATAEIKDNADLASAVFTPINAQGTTSARIPFSFVNSKDLSSKPDKPPLDGLARLALAIYRGEADYRQNLFMQGQDTLVRIGPVQDEDEVVRTGAGARIDVPMNGDAKYIGASGKGLPEQRSALEADYKRAEAKGSKLMNASSAESGDALNIRVAAQTATLPQIAQTSANALAYVLRVLAEMLGDNPDDIVVTPNLEFADASGDGVTLTQIVQAKVQGAPISDESIHAWMVEQGFTNKTYEDELAAIQGEEPKI